MKFVPLRGFSTEFMINDADVGSNHKLLEESHLTANTSMLYRTVDVI